MNTTNDKPKVQRDPRIDPRPGDVLQKGDWTRKVYAVSSVAAIRYSRVHCRTMNADDRYCYIGGWKRWARTSDVMTIAPDELSGGDIQ